MAGMHHRVKETTDESDVAVDCSVPKMLCCGIMLLCLATFELK